MVSPTIPFVFQKIFTDSNFTSAESFFIQFVIQATMCIYKWQIHPADHITVEIVRDYINVFQFNIGHFVLVY